MFCIEDVRSKSLDAGDPAGLSFFGLLFLLRFELKVATEERQSIELPTLEWISREDLITGKVLLPLDSSARVSSSGGRSRRKVATILVSLAYSSARRQTLVRSTSLSLKGS